MRLGTRMGGCQSCHSEAPRPLSRCDERRIVSISRAGDDVIVTLNDCTYLRAPMSVVDSSLKQGISNSDDLVKAVEELQKKFALLDSSLLPVTGFDEEEAYSVIGTKYTNEVKQDGNESPAP